jgi:hypothetical protein
MFLRLILQIHSGPLSYHLASVLACWAHFMFLPLGPCFLLCTFAPYHLQHLVMLSKSQQPCNQYHLDLRTKHRILWSGLFLCLKKGNSRLEVFNIKKRVGHKIIAKHPKLIELYSQEFHWSMIGACSMVASDTSWWRRIVTTVEIASGPGAWRHVKQVLTTIGII